MNNPNMTLAAVDADAAPAAILAGEVFAVVSAKWFGPKPVSAEGNETALEAAKQGNHQDVAAMLIAAGANS